MTMHLHFSNVYVNTLEHARLRLMIFRAKDDWDEKSKNTTFEKYEFRPAFDKEIKVFWTDSTLSFASASALLDFAFDKFVTTLEADRQR